MPKKIELGVRDKLGEIINTDNLPEQIYQNILVLIGDVVNSTSQSLFLKDKKTGQLIEAARQGDKVDLIDFVPFDLGTGFSAWVAKQKRPITIGNIKNRPENAFTSFVAVPLISISETIGVITLAHKKKNAFSKNDVEKIDALSHEIAAALQIVVYRQQIQQMTTSVNHLNKSLRSTKSELVNCKVALNNNSRIKNLLINISVSLELVGGTTRFLLENYSDAEPALVERLSVIKQATDNMNNQINTCENYLHKITTASI